MKKRGAVTPDEIVLTILAIVGFVIVMLVLLTVFDLEETSEDEICKLSVLTRATVPAEAPQLVPLKCTTKKTCLTYGKNRRHTQKTRGD